MTVYLVLSLERYFSRIAYDSREWNTVKTSKNTMILRKIFKIRNRRN